MCRIAAYAGEPISLHCFLQQPPHSLFRQSWAAREMRNAAVNADGFGVGWYDDQHRPRRYLNTVPVWTDPNLTDLGRCLHSSCWVGNVRSATDGMQAGYASTQPFCAPPWLFVHNGYLGEFATLRPQLNRLLPDALQGTMAGTTDSEYLFSLWQMQQQRLQHPLAALAATAQTIQTLAPQARHLLSITVTDGNGLYALRHAINAPAPSLYQATDSGSWPRGVAVASEPVDAAGWQPIPAHTLLELSPGRRPQLTPL